MSRLARHLDALMACFPRVSGDEPVSLTKFAPA